MCLSPRSLCCSWYVCAARLTVSGCNSSHFQLKKVMQVEYTLNVQSGSAYAHLNGRNFPAVSQWGERITLLINGVSTDFTINEVKKHYVESGTWYNSNTAYQVIQVLEQCRQNRTRIILDYGDTQTGKSWGEIHDVCGYVGRSTGSQKIPILVFNSRSYGGGAILTHCIVSIKTSAGKRVLYQHPTYQPFEG